MVAGALQMALSMSPRPLGQTPAKRGFRVAKRDAGKGGSPAGVARRRRVAAAKGRKAMPFMRGQLARNKKEHATHCRRLPGGRPLIHIIEPKWWKDSKQRRQTCGGRGKPGMCDDPAKALPRIHTQISIVRREQLMLDTYATDRMCSESIHLLPTAELGRAAGTIRSAKLKIKDNLRLLERAAEEPYGAAGEKSGGQRLFKLGLVERGKQRYLKNLARGVEPLLRFEPTEMDGLSEMDRRVGLVLDILNDEFRGQMMPAETGGSEWGAPELLAAR